MTNRKFHLGLKRHRVWSEPVVVAASSILAGLVALMATGPLHNAMSAMSAGGCLLLGVAMWRSVGDGGDRRVWLAFGGAGVAVGVALLMELALETRISQTGEDGGWSGSAFGASAVVFSSLFYGGVIIWNPRRSDESDRGDWLNGVCAVLISVALGGILLRISGAVMSSWAEMQMTLWLLHVSMLLIVGGSAMTVARLQGPGGGNTLRAVAAVFGVAMVLQLLLGFLDRPDAAERSIQFVWVVAIAVVAASRGVPAVQTTLDMPASQSATVGSFVVIITGCVVLALNGLLDARVSTVCLAGAAIAGSGVRMLHLIRMLALLATSRREAYTDELTGIANRRALSRAIAEVEAGGKDASLLSIDLDRFKDVNDRHGHGAGDEVLLALAARMRYASSVGSLLARQGGDEFALLLVGATSRTGFEVARALVAACREPVPTRAGAVALSVSVGVASTEDGGRVSGELLRRSDAAMYVAKQARDGVAVFDADTDARAAAERDKLDELRVILSPDATAGDRAQVVVHYQPQVDVATGRVVGAEALVRWMHPVRGLVPPGEFLELVERWRMMSALTSLVMGEAVREATRWRAAGLDLRLSVNISASSLGHPDLISGVARILEQSGLSSSALCLEVTESALMDDPEQAMDAMVSLARTGIDISIDDYGTGYSSLSYLVDLPASELKLDRSFTKRVLDDDRTGAVVVSTIELAGRLGLRVVAEGVEDAATLDFLRRSGCAVSQGYFHARPMDARSFLRWALDADAQWRELDAPSALGGSGAAARAGAPGRGVVAGSGAS